MRTDLNEIRSRFDELLTGTVDRKSVSDWARDLRIAEDNRELIVTPEDDRARIWTAILFLEGVDSKDSPDSYLHNEEDIRRERP